jgi:hypothetical protein
MTIKILIRCTSDEGDQVEHTITVNGSEISLLSDYANDFDFQVINEIVQDKDDFIKVVKSAAPKLPSDYDNKCVIIGVDEQMVDPEELYFADYATSLN